ncbi:pimeloyl-ACP methyl ester carboxylesterase [Streptomyces sp. Ag109_G2-6]|uniref:alpha/beta fold hydrolase n=1 Tax=Streptomyces sp. Ag109_G2-6 TaxID=2485154 RepID=UPI000F5065AE|nr:alpha/beta hydrolase [Streptomyces sp. Ag109_G2-6]RPF46511.1 pimeloyl-ACP methyl ester carboxylesterase [Streptomyces sp. Ag109_G2-6]
MRHTLDIDGRTLSYLDFGGTGRPLLALHGGMSEAYAFTGLAAALGDAWRVIAPDQRGHGDSDRAPHYRREGYVADAVALLDHLGLTEPVALLGYSLGGLNAYHLAAAHPDRIGLLIGVDATVDVNVPDGPNWFDFLGSLPYTAPTREELLASVEPAALPFVADGVRPLPGGEGWRLAFHGQDMLDSIRACNGDHWNTWLAITCPTLLIRATHSQALSQATADAMVTRRPGTAYTALEGDHFAPFTDPEGFHAAVAKYLAQAA